MTPYSFDVSRLGHIENKDLITHINTVGRVFYVFGE